MSETTTPETDQLANKQHAHICASCNDPADLMRDALDEMGLLARKLERELAKARKERDKRRSLAEGLAQGLQRIESSDSTGDIYLDVACMRGIAREALRAYEEAKK